jgi:flagellar hook assembly protein FlgD
MKDQLSIKLTQDDGAAVGENRIDIYNIKGQLVRSVQLGKGETQWDGKDKQGQNCPSGVYLLRSTNHSIHTTKICKSY